ncbi:MAG: glycosyltransferase family 2 protein [Nitrospirae bacterium]|nr:glycosyltransferase family 2 protein [Nitrospirota bacterium]MBF0541900.1 glycosyltransferase family 2 protein [Nitrospirota bacterium]
MIDSQVGISFIVPVYNEEDSVVNTIERLKNTFKTIDIAHEIILVNDGSLDKTVEVIKQESDIKVISHPINIGYGNAIKTGIKNAQYEWIGIVDADGTYKIERLKDLIDEMKKGFDMVVAARSNLHQLDGILKRIFRWLFVFFIKFTINKKIEDPNSGFRIFKRSIVLDFFPFLCGEFSFTTTLTIFCYGEECFVRYLPIEYGKRTGSSKVKHIRDTIKAVQLIIQGIIYYNPIKFYLLFSIFMGAFVAFPSMVLALLRWYTLSLYFLIWGIASILLIAIGVLGDIMRMGQFKKKT